MYVCIINIFIKSYNMIHLLNILRITQFEEKTHKATTKNIYEKNKISIE